MKKPCKECPHFIRNRHNDIIVDFGDKKWYTFHDPEEWFLNNFEIIQEPAE
jgi:hypothetical protein